MRRIKSTTKPLTRAILETLIAEAWDYLWKDNLKSRKANRDFDGNTYYLTATDLEHQVRSFLKEDLQGKKRGSLGRGSYGFHEGIRVSVGPGGLLGRCRDWLAHAGLDRHNFGRGHISGMRYRPRGAPLSPGEAKTLETEARRDKAEKEGTAVVHLRDPEVRGYGSGKTLCTRASRAKQRAKRSYHGWKQSRSHAHLTGDQTKVTCPRCLKVIAEIGLDNLVKKAKCADCGKLFPEDELTDGVCEGCDDGGEGTQLGAGAGDEQLQ